MFTERGIGEHFVWVLKTKILDVKLWMVLYEEASPEKVARMEKVARVLID